MFYLVRYLFEQIRISDYVMLFSTMGAATLVGMLLPKLNSILFSDVLSSKSVSMLLGIAIYQINRTFSSIDTDKLNALVKDGYLSALVDNAFAGRDPVPNVRKRTRVTYVYDGREATVEVGEGSRLVIPAPVEAPQPPPEWEWCGADGVLAWQPLEMELESSDGSKRTLSAKPAAPVAVEGGWKVSFPSGWDAPESIVFPKLIAWDRHPDDGVKYFVVSIDGENAENLQGWKTKYEYDTKWPYPWIEGNSPNNCLQVNLNVNKLHKLDAWMKFKTTAFDEPLVGVVGGDPLVGANPDTDIEYSKAYREGEGSVSFASSDESVVKVDPYSGELTVVGPGTATITICGIATYYRNAPKSISYKVKIYKPGDANGDGNVDAADIVEAVNFKLGTSSAKFIMAAADMNGDGNIDETDILQIVSIILGK